MFILKGFKVGFMRKTKIVSLILMMSTSAFASDINVGVKGIYIGQSGDDACKIIEKNFQQGTFVDKKEHDYPDQYEPTNRMGIVIASRVCYRYLDPFSELLLVTMDSNNRVEAIEASYRAFGVKKMAIEKFAQLFVDNYDWVDSLEYGEDSLLGRGYYEHTDNKKLGYKLTINGSTVRVKKVSVEKPVNNNPSFN